MQRRIFLQAVLAGTFGAPLIARAAAPVIEVYKSASCGCCEGWVKHLQDNGFSVNTHDVANPGEYREKFGMPQALASCHTALVQGYVIEGHVPASDIRQLLAQRPKARGLAVPAMPMGTPGMEGPRSDPYDVLLVQADGRYSTYRHYNASGPASAAAPAGAVAAMSEGVIKKVDKDGGKITIRHGALKNLDMPPMTMSFRVKEPAMLEQLRPGDQIGFVAEQIDGRLTVTRIEAKQ